MMAGIRNENTKPEMFVRRGLHRRGLRFRLHQSDLPGRPDVVMAKYKTIIFIHGCFWHGHDCDLFKWPKTREDFWRSKINTNRIRDLDIQRRLLLLGWDIEVVWECQLRTAASNAEATLDRLTERIKSRREPSSALRQGRDGDRRTTQSLLR